MLLHLLAVSQWCLVAFTHLNVVSSVEIRRLSVPRWVQNGSQESVVLDCEYAYNENDIRLVVKWFFNESVEPIYQWIPELNVRHTSGILKNKLDLDFSVNTVDAYSKFRALRIPNPSTELSGQYTCLVTSLAGQDSRTQFMTVFVPARTMEVKYSRASYSQLNVSCEATGLFPRPRLRLYKLSRSEKSPVIVRDVQTSVTNSDDSYNVTLHKNFGQNELNTPKTTAFECVVEIPGTNYQRKKRVAYYAEINGAQNLMVWSNTGNVFYFGALITAVLTVS